MRVAPQILQFVNRPDVNAVCVCEHALKASDLRSRTPRCRRTRPGEWSAVSVIGTENEPVSGFVGDGLSEPHVQGGILVSILTYMFYVEPIIAAVSLLLLIPQACWFHV
jgi:hypothetical protein